MILFIIVLIILILDIFSIIEDIKNGKMKSDNYESDCNYD